MTILLLALPSFAAPSYEDGGIVLTAPDSGPFVEGINAPTVEWDGGATQFVMYFESPAPVLEVPEVCKNSYRIGRATSADGRSWVVDETAVVEPEPDNESGNRRCSVSQPAVVYDGTTWHLFFSQATTDNAAAGVAYATSPDGVHFTVQSDPAIPSDVSGVGLASAAIVDGVLYVAYSRDGEIRVASRDLTGGDWVLGDTSVLTAAMLADWDSASVLAASLTCDEGFAMTFASDSSASVRSLAVAASADGVSWTIDGPLTGTLDYTQVKHWDVLTVSAGVQAMWYSRDEAGKKAIGLATTGTAMDAPHGRACPDPWAPVDTGGDDTGGEDTAVVDSGDTDTSSDTSPGGEDSEAAGKPEETEGGCGCDGGGGGVMAIAVLAGLVGVGGRGRRAIQGIGTK